MASMNLNMQVSFRWWLKPYLIAVHLLYGVIRREYKAGRFVIKHGVKFKIVSEPNG